MILVVDDEPAIAEVIGSVLQDEGYSVATAPDGEAALAILRDGATHPCLAFLDLMMPGMNGWELREAMLADPALASVPVVILSAFTAGDMGSLRSVAVIQKPFQLDQIVDLAARHCAGAQGAP